MQTFQDEKVKAVFDSYPKEMREKLLLLRELVFDVAREEKSIESIEETLKWNEPSYISKRGSTLRMGWKKSKPHHYSLYFNCKTKLVETFRGLFSDRFTFEGNREIFFDEDDTIDIEALKYCILLSLTYHDRKHLVMLDS